MTKVLQVSKSLFYPKPSEDDDVIIEDDESSIPLIMECEDDDLSESQIAAFEKAQAEYNKVQKQIEEMKSDPGIEIIYESTPLSSPVPLKVMPGHAGRNGPRPVSVGRGMAPTNSNMQTRRGRGMPTPVSVGRGMAPTPRGEYVRRGRGRPASNYVPRSPTVQGGMNVRNPTPVQQFGANRGRGGGPRTYVYNNFVKKAHSASKDPDSTQKVVLISQNITYPTTGFLANTKDCYPELITFARPLNTASEAVTKAKRAELDATVKSVLIHNPSKFTEWLIQKGLVRAQQYCNVHLNAQKESVKFKLAMYSDSTRFPHTGGYVWISHCCPNRFVSVFNGSIFEGAKNSPVAVLKLIYHWACQTNIQNVVQWVKVDPQFVHKFFRMLRGLCSLTIYNTMPPLGGAGKTLELGLIQFIVNSPDTGKKDADVEVFGIYDRSTKQVRLRVVPPSIRDMNAAPRSKQISMLEPFPCMADKESNFVIDSNFDADVMEAMGCNAKNIKIYTGSPPDAPAEDNNYYIMNYLKRHVNTLFQNTMDKLSVIAIQLFLDELVWREKWGQMAGDTFNNLMEHLAAQTKVLENNQEGLVSRLTRVTINPMTVWIFGMKGKPNNDVRAALANLANKQGIRNINTGRYQVQPIKRTGPMIDQSAIKKPALENVGVMRERVIGDEMVPLERYYYGYIPGRTDDIEEPCEFTAKCHICNQEFSSNVTLLSHLFLHIDSSSTIVDSSETSQCNYCFRSFGTPYALETHIEIAHIHSSAKSCCWICNLTCRDESSLIAHMIRVHKQLEMPYFCEVCDYRSSLHRNVMEHFQTEHVGLNKVICYFCLKTFKATITGIFFAHLQRHYGRTRDNVKNKCKSCSLSFHKDTHLRDHMKKDHSTYKSYTDVKPITLPSGYSPIMIPKPDGSLSSRSFVPKRPINAVPTTDVTEQPYYKFQTYKELNISANKADTCSECNTSITKRLHFTGYWCCNKCRFATCCFNALEKHMNVFHVSLKPQFQKSKPYIMNKRFHCVCGFSHTSGNKLANHLAICNKKSVYGSAELAAEASVTTTSASFPPLVSLDDQDNQTDPSLQWMQAFTKSKKTQQVEKTEQKDEAPSLLNMLGLVRRRSVDGEDEEDKKVDESNTPKDEVEDVEMAEECEKKEDIDKNTESPSAETDNETSGKEDTPQEIDEKKTSEEVSKENEASEEANDKEEHSKEVDNNGDTSKDEKENPITEEVDDKSQNTEEGKEKYTSDDEKCESNTNGDSDSLKQSKGEGEEINKEGDSESLQQSEGESEESKKGSTKQQTLTNGNEA